MAQIITELPAFVRYRIYGIQFEKMISVSIDINTDKHETPRDIDHLRELFLKNGDVSVDPMMLFDNEIIRKLPEVKENLIHPEDVKIMDVKKP